jgi:hypothetical protein
MDSDQLIRCTNELKVCVARANEIARLTNSFCDAHLNEEYKELCREMAVAICQKGSPVLKGKPEGWAAGVVNALGYVNFLCDPTQTPHVKSLEVAKGFGVSIGTMQAKARLIREGLDLMPLQPEWCLPSKMDNNSMVWMLKVNGFLVDIRKAERELQVVAYENGLIPYIPDDRRESDQG